MSSAEFAEWQAFQRLEGTINPLERDDWRMAMIVATIANANRDPKQRRRPYEPKEFIPDWPGDAGVRKPKLHPDVVAAKVQNFFQGVAQRAKGGRG